MNFDGKYIYCSSTQTGILLMYIVLNVHPIIRTTKVGRNQKNFLRHLHSGYTRSGVIRKSWKSTAKYLWKQLRLNRKKFEIEAWTLPRNVVTLQIVEFVKQIEKKSFFFLPFPLGLCKLKYEATTSTSNPRRISLVDYKKGPKRRILWMTCKKE